MATDKEYQALIDSLSGECERLHKENKELKALSQEPCEDCISRQAVLEIQVKYAEHMGATKYWQMRDDIRDLPSVTQKSKYWIDKDTKIYKMPNDIPTMTIQYPTITHEDTISRTEVMKVISDFVTFEKYIDKHNHITFEPLEQMINSLPSVTQKSGKWITTRTFMHDGEYYCDRCKCDAPNNEKWDYCPNCGAKMESEE